MQRYSFCVSLEVVPQLVRPVRIVLDHNFQLAFEIDLLLDKRLHFQRHLLAHALRHRHTQHGAGVALDQLGKQRLAFNRGIDEFLQRPWFGVWRGLLISLVESD